MINQVLMCRPSHFRVDYQINPWMQLGSVNSSKAMQQWENLVMAYQNSGIIVEIIEQNENQPDMVFATDQGIIHNKTALISNFRHPERQGESEHYQKWLSEKGFKLAKIPEGYFFEGGGEYLKWQDKLFIGEGFRTCSLAHTHLREVLETECIPLQLISEHFYHLDTCFFVLNDETAFYYPPAFSQKSQQKLQTLIPNLIEFSQEEVLNFAANSVVSGQTVFLQKGSPYFVEKLEKFGYHTVELDISEFMKAGGGIHCLTLVLEEKTHNIEIKMEQKMYEMQTTFN